MGISRGLQKIWHPPTTLYSSHSRHEFSLEKQLGWTNCSMRPTKPRPKPANHRSQTWNFFTHDNLVHYHVNSFPDIEPGSLGWSTPSKREWPAPPSDFCLCQCHLRTLKPVSLSLAKGILVPCCNASQNVDSQSSAG